MQCPEAHLFCTTCMMSYAETKLGEHDARIVCMDQSGCKLPFPDSELRRFLTPKLLELYERVKQRKEIEAAGLEGLEECPFCEYKVVIENDHERLFRCENEACGAVTCRQCKKLVSVRCCQFVLLVACCCGLLHVVSCFTRRLGPSGNLPRFAWRLPWTTSVRRCLAHSSPIDSRDADHCVLSTPIANRIICQKAVKVRRHYYCLRVRATVLSLTRRVPPATPIGRAEVDDDKKLDVRHRIEEAMSASWACLSFGDTVLVADNWTASQPPR